MSILKLLALPGLQAGSLVLESWEAFRGSSRYADVPPVRASLRVVGEAVLDRSFKLSMNLLTGIPHPAELRRAREEALAAVALYARQGWLERPAAYHPQPPPLEAFELEARGFRLGPRKLPYGHLRFESGYAPHPEMPGAARWHGFEKNRMAHAFVLEHPGRPRPWLVCVHGFGMGTPGSLFPGFAARWLHRELRLNLVFPVLPLHGPRASGRLSGGDLLAPDYLNLVHAFSQGVSDLRGILSWVRARGARKVGLYGISLGGYHAAIVAGLEADLACVVAGIPPVDFPSVARDNEPWLMQNYDADLQMDWNLIRTLTHVVSPLAFDPLPPRARRFIFAGTADRVVRPDQARALWRHWERPEIHWYATGHVTAMWKRSLREFLKKALRRSRMV